MHIVILTFQGFNELDSFVALSVLNRVKASGWRVSLCSPEKHVTPMNGVTVQAQSSLEDVHFADAVIIDSGINTLEIIQDTRIMSALRLDSERQLIRAQCSGTLILAKLGLLKNVPACRDLTSRGRLQNAGIEALDQPFYATGNVGTAGGCLASQYLVAWTIACLLGDDAAKKALLYVAPVGEKDEHVEKIIKTIYLYIPN